MTNICTLTQTTYKGFEALVVENGRFQLTLVPELGGKLVSLRDVATGREWLWTNPHLPAKPVVYDASFVEAYDTGGFDECFPAVSGGAYPAAPWHDITIPDHGELWCQPWEVDSVAASAERIVLKLVCHGVRFPYRFARTLTITADNPLIQLAYEVTNLTPFAMPFVWSSHPILNIEPGMQISLPDSVQTVRIDGATNDFVGKAGDKLPWPLAQRANGQPLDLSRVPARDFGQAVKLYTLPMEEEGMVETAVSTPDNHALTFRFQPSQISHVGLWLNYGGWSGCGSAPYFNLGLEPCIGGTDSLAEAIKLGEYGRLLAKESRSWSLELLVT